MEIFSKGTVTKNPKKIQNFTSVHFSLYNFGFWHEMVTWAYKWVSARKKVSDLGQRHLSDDETSFDVFIAI